jgi:hypothetical protein
VVIEVLFILNLLLRIPIKSGYISTLRSLNSRGNTPRVENITNIIIFSTPPHFGLLAVKFYPPTYLIANVITYI